MKTLFSRLIRSVALAVTAVTLVFSGAVQAQDYPTKPVKLMVGWSAGGSTDVYARALASYINESLGMPMVVVNQPGASGMIAGKSTLSAPHDGYTLYAQSGGTFLVRMRIAEITGSGNELSPYDDFQPLGTIGTVVTGLIVPADSPFKSAADLVAYAKEHPGELRWANPGNGSLHTLAGNLFLADNGITAQGVPFKGGSKTRNAVAGGQVDFGFMGISLLAGFGDQLQALGVTSADRDPIYKDVPTFGEQGLPQMGISSPLVIWGAMDMPADASAKAVEAIQATVMSEGYGKLLKKAGLSAAYASPEETLTALHALDETVTPVIKQLFGN